MYFDDEPYKLLDMLLLRTQNEFKDYESSYQSYLKAQEQRQSMQKRLTELSKLLESGNVSTNEAQRHISALQTTLAAQESHLDEIVKSVPPSARQPPQADRLAREIFAIPELFEHILHFLDIKDLLRAQKVNHAWFDAIKASHKIQHKLCLIPNPKCKFYVPFGSYHFPGLSSTVEMWFFQNRGLTENQILFQTTMYARTRSKPLVVGSRYRSMFICQPPLMSMEVFTSCCHPNTPYTGPITPLETITPKTRDGITVGDVWDAFDRICPEHELCPDAPEYMHDPDGYVRTRVTFEARVDVQKDDPYLIDTKQQIKRRREEEEETRQSQTRLRPYIAAKRVARAAGEKIPTLAEFEATAETEAS